MTSHRIRLSLAWGLSLGAHAGLLLLRPWSAPVPEPHVESPIEITAVPPDEGPSPLGSRGKGRAGRSGAGTHRSTAPALSLGDLGIGWRAGLPSGTGTEDTVHGQEADGSADGGLAGMSLTAVSEAIYDRIDEALEYPAELKAHHIEGAVKVRLYFSAEGKFVREKSSATSASRYLRVLVWRTLREALSERLPSSFLHGRPLVVRCLFQFAGVSPGAGHVVRGQLAFYREGEFSGEWHAGPVTGYGIAPAVSIDPGWFVDAIKNLGKNRAEVDPLEKYRRDPEWER